MLGLKGSYGLRETWAQPQSRQKTSWVLGFLVWGACSIEQGGTLGFVVCSCVGVKRHLCREGAAQRLARQAQYAPDLTSALIRSPQRPKLCLQLGFAGPLQNRFCAHKSSSIFLCLNSGPFLHVLVCWGGGGRIIRGNKDLSLGNCGIEPQMLEAHSSQTLGPCVPLNASP